MSVGYQPNCRVCTSPHRVEIEMWCRQGGLHSRAASAKLLEVYGHKISQQSIWSHMKDHFDVTAAAREQYIQSNMAREQYIPPGTAREQYAQSKVQMQHQVEKQLSDIEMLERTAAANYELACATVAWLRELIEQRKNPPIALVHLREKLQAEMRQAMRAKAEFLGDDPQSRLMSVFQALWDRGGDADAEPDNGHRTED